MVLAEWHDGYILDYDFRREDPLYYYVLKDYWKDAVGIQIDPLYNEASAKEVTISIFQPHLERPPAATAEARQKIFLRVLPVFMQRFPGWKRITLRDDFLPAMLPELDEIFQQVKFVADQSKSGANEQVWRRWGWFDTVVRWYL